MSGKSVVKESSSFYDVLDSVPDSSFSGKSNFDKFSASERLEWLERARADLLELKGMSGSLNH